MSQAVGKPVRLQFMRWDEHGWTHYGPALMYRHAGRHRRQRQHGRLRGDAVRPGGHLALHQRRARRLGPDPTANAIPTVGNFSADSENTSPWMQVAQAAYAATTSWSASRSRDPRASSRAARCVLRPRRRRRSATPRLMDMLAVASAMDRSTSGCRTSHRLADQRWAACCRQLASAANWEPGSPRGLADGHGRTTSPAAASRTATTAAPTPGCADVQVNKKTGKISVTDLWGGQDTGSGLQPRPVYNQMIGNLIRVRAARYGRR